MGKLFWYCWQDGGDTLLLDDVCVGGLSLVLCDRRRFRTGSLEYVGVFCFWGYVIGGSNCCSKTGIEA